MFLILDYWLPILLKGNITSLDITVFSCKILHHHLQSKLLNYEEKHLKNLCYELSVNWDVFVAVVSDGSI